MKIEEIPVIIEVDKEKLKQQLQQINGDCKTCLYYIETTCIHYCLHPKEKYCFRLSEEKITEIIKNSITIQDGQQ